MHVDDKKGQTSRYVESLKEIYGNGASNLCLVYNASGDTLRCSAAHRWYSSFYGLGCPPDIGNGQWAAFLHVHNTGVPTGSAYCEIGGVNFHEERWEEIEQRLEGSQYSSYATSDGLEIEAQTEPGTSPMFTAIIRA
ncbi:hypothetical protein C2845_PM01G42300 [Panicum miliaceum]|uniref:Uncharacterized protein n=1 Tax=Panicum miliaceum TaxID=4540 RepID=A0A3L6TRT8_PANMI|nr:hypothetical protein C2845_PM01G42300 [Panicum miliaceum]